MEEWKDEKLDAVLAVGGGSCGDPPPLFHAVFRSSSCVKPNTLPTLLRFSDMLPFGIKNTCNAPELCANVLRSCASTLCLLCFDAACAVLREEHACWGASVASKPLQYSLYQECD